MAHRDRVGGSSGRRKVAGDAVHRQNFSTPSDGAVKPPSKGRQAGFAGPFFQVFTGTVVRRLPAAARAVSPALSFSAASPATFLLPDEPPTRSL